MNPELLGALIALGTALFGGVGLELLRRTLSTPDRMREQWIVLATELRTDLKDVRERSNYYKEQSDLWEERYHRLQEEFLAYRNLMADRVGRRVAEDLRVTAAEIGERRRDEVIRGDQS